jgi:hypothetical protein
MAKVGSGESAAAVIAALTRVVAFVGLIVAIAAAQESAFPPSTPDGEPHIDYTRKVLSCNDHGCRLIVVRSQEELLSALIGRVRDSEPSTMVQRRYSSLNPQQRENEEVAADVEPIGQNHFSYGLRLILGGCFGGELPMTFVSESTVVTISPEVGERIQAAVARLREHRQVLNSTSQPKTDAPAAQLSNVR